MGTNYYLYERPPCKKCGRDYERLHIGKSSAGWCFGLHVEPGDPDHPQSLDGWVARWSRPDAEIRNEYGDKVSPEAMLSTITERAARRSRPGDAQWYRQNSAMPGPGNLARHTLGSFCVGHGEGTWDLLRGEFS